MGKYKVLGFLPIYYGKPFLKEALLSIRDHADKVVVSFTATPSHGMPCSLPNPDTEEELYDICQSVLGWKLQWLRAQGYANEGYHRDTRYNFANGYDVILSIDSDECFEGVPEALDYVMAGEAQYYGVRAYGYVNFWRSFNFQNRDAFAPIRFERLDKKNGLQDLGTPLTVYHFSTALPEKYMRLKYCAFGHSNEVKENYLDEIFYKWTPEKVKEITHLHPTSNDIWHEAQPFDKTTLPEYLKQHPFYELDIIP